jgi:hypothetical protein
MQCPYVVKSSGFHLEGLDWLGFKLGEAPQLTVGELTC